MAKPITDLSKKANLGVQKDEVFHKTQIKTFQSLSNLVQENLLKLF